VFTWVLRRHSILSYSLYMAGGLPWEQGTRGTQGWEEQERCAGWAAQGVGCLERVAVYLLAWGALQDSSGATCQMACA
jgi:hypothetical protein